MWEMIQQFFNGVADFFVGIFNFIFGGAAELVLGGIQHLLGTDIFIPPDVYAVVNEISIGVGYIIPVDKLLPIPIFMILFYSVKLVFSIYQLIAGTIVQRVRLRL